MSGDERGGGVVGIDGGGPDTRLRTDGGRRQNSIHRWQSADRETDTGGRWRALARNLGLVVLTLLLAANLAGFSVVLAAQSTVLDADYVVETMADGEVYGDMETRVEEGIASEANSRFGEISAYPDTEEVIGNAVREAVTPEYVRTEATTTLRDVYDFLHGRSETLRLTVDTTRLGEAIPDAVATEIREMPLAEFVRQPTVEDTFADLDTERLAATIEDPETFRETQRDVQQRLEATGRDREDIRELLRAETDLGNVSAGVEESVYDLEDTVVESFTSDTDHEEYVSQLEADRDAFAAAVGKFTRQQFESDIGSTIDLTGRLSPSDERTLQQNRRLVTTVSLAVYALPLVTLVVIVVVLTVTHSLGRTSLVLGASMLTAGIGGLVASPVVEDRVLGVVRESVAGTEEFVARTAVAVIDGLLDQLALQSAVFVGVGLVFVAVSYAIGKLEPAWIPARWR